MHVEQGRERANDAVSRRYGLAAVLALTATYLLIEGVRLILLGGSFYYAIAGLSLVAAAYYGAKGDKRCQVIYGAMLLGTLVWVLAENGLDWWGLQARLVAPVLLGVWVCWPLIRRVPRVIQAAVLLLILVGGASLILANAQWERPSDTSASATPGGADWTQYGNDLAGTRFSRASLITPANVHDLEHVWTYRTGVKESHMGFEATPLMVGGMLYLCTPTNIVIALDPDTGKQRWRFDPRTDAPPIGTCRGVAYYHVPGPTGPCADRIISATTDARLFALDAQTGQLCTGFGTSGMVDLRQGMGHVTKGYYYVSSAPAIVRGRVILGGWVMDGQYVGEPSGVIRAFDATTGQFAWAWDMDRPHDHDLPKPGQSFSRGTANSWGPISGDEQLGLVFLPTGNSTPDYWGGRRSVANFAGHSRPFTTTSGISTTARSQPWSTCRSVAGWCQP